MTLKRKDWGEKYSLPFGNMSKIGKQPIALPDQVTFAQQGVRATVTGPKGSLFFDIPMGIKANVVDKEIIVTQVKENDRVTNALFGLTRACLANLVKGVTVGFEKKLELSGVGYRAQATGNTLTLSLGFSHPVIIKSDSGIQ